MFFDFRSFGLFAEKVTLCFNQFSSYLLYLMFSAAHIYLDILLIHVEKVKVSSYVVPTRLFSYTAVLLTTDFKATQCDNFGLSEIFKFMKFLKYLHGA